MPGQPTTRAQVSGYRFLLTRLDHALVRHDVRMLHDPMRSQLRSMLVGVVIGLLGVAVCTILAFLRPQGAVGDARIVIGKDSGALYVVMPGEQGASTLHPVLNLASARLITASNSEPVSVKDAKLASIPRGPLLGIPGAPADLPGSGQGTRSDWTLCDQVALSPTGSAAAADSATMTALAGRPVLDTRIHAMAGTDALLVRHDNRTYLIYDGKRAAVDLGNIVVARVLDLAGQRPRPATTGLLDAVAEAPALAPPPIPGAGRPGPGRLSNVPIGGIIAVSGTPGTDTNRPNLYVVLGVGVQPVSPLAAQLIRGADSYGMNEIRTVAPDVLDEIPTVHVLPTDQFPATAPRILGAEQAPVACMTWSKSAGTVQAAAENPADRASMSMLAGNRLPLADSARPVPMVGGGAGDRADAVHIPPSTGEFIEVTGTDADSVRRDSLFYVADSGIRYGIPDMATAATLGLDRSPHLAPWAVVGRLVPGPTLSKQDALVSYNTLREQH